MKGNGFMMATRLGTREVADEFKTYCLGTYSGAAKTASFLRKALGQLPDAQAVEFFAPRGDSPFAELEQDRPAFSVGASIPKASGTGGGVVVLQLYVWDRNDHREVSVLGPSSMGSSSATNRRLADLQAAFHRADPQARFGAGRVTDY